MDKIAALRQHMVEPMRAAGIRTMEDPIAPGLPYFTGYKDGKVFDWDQYFEAILQLYAGFEHTYIRNVVTLFLNSQERSGHTVRTFPRAFWFQDMAKPFLAQSTLLLARAGDDMEWFTPELFLAHEEVPDALAIRPRPPQGRAEHLGLRPVHRHG